jgi:hypothetical protein
VKTIHPEDAAHDPDVWSAFIWGQKRDWVLVKRLRTAKNIAKLKEDGRVHCAEGIIRGKNPFRQKDYDWLLNRHILDTDSFPENSMVFVEAKKLPLNKNPTAERPRKVSSFSTPQLIIKQGWSIENKRFPARIVMPDDLGRGVVCSQSYLSVCTSEGNETLLEAAYLSCNSLLAVYFLLLTSGRFSAYRPETLASEIPRIPISEKSRMLGGIRTYDDVDNIIREAFELKEAEWVLIEDLCRVTLEDFKGNTKSLGRKPTNRRLESITEPEIRGYCEYFIRVLKAGYGQEKHITATIFQETYNDHLPYRLVAFELNRKSDEQICVELINSSSLLVELEKLNKTWLSTQKTINGSIFYRRVARIYDFRNKMPTIFILKPDAYRYWTRSMGLHDADEVAADFARWQTEKTD